MQSVNKYSVPLPQDIVKDDIKKLKINYFNYSSVLKIDLIFKENHYELLYLKEKNIENIMDSIDNFNNEKNINVKHLQYYNLFSLLNLSFVDFLYRNNIFVSKEDSTIYVYKNENQLLQIPIAIINKMEKDFNNEEYEDDVMRWFHFYILLLLNPYYEIRTTLMKFVEDFNVTITKSGYMALYKRVNIKVENEHASKILQLVTEAKRQKQSLSKVYITIDENNHYKIKRLHKFNQDVKTLEDEYKEVLINNELEFTDTYYKTDSITVGKKIEVDYHKSNDTHLVCSSQGRHVGSYKYVFTYLSDIEYVLLILVSPEDVIGMPSNEGKIRVSTYYAYSMIEKKYLKKGLPYDINVYDFDYSTKDLEVIKQRVLSDSEKFKYTRDKKVKNIREAFIKKLKTNVTTTK